MMYQDDDSIAFLKNYTTQLEIFKRLSEFYEKFGMLPTEEEKEISDAPASINRKFKRLRLNSQSPSNSVITEINSGQDINFDSIKGFLNKSFNFKS